MRRRSDAIEPPRRAALQKLGQERSETDKEADGEEDGVDFERDGKGGLGFGYERA